MIKKILIFLPFFLPSFAFAATTHHFDCTDIASTDASVSCTDGVWTASAPGSAVWSTGGYEVPAGTNYVSAVVSNASHFQLSCYDGSANPCTGISLSDGENFDVSMNFDSTAGLYIFGNGGGGWTVSDLCVTDTLGDCGSAPPPMPTSTVASTTVMNNPNQDFFNGIVAFFAMFYGMIWLFRKQR